MPKMTQMMQRAYTMRKQMKRMQKELAKQTVEVKSNNGKVTVSVRGDMSVREIHIDPSAYTDLKPERLEKVLVTTVNSALNAAKKSAGSEMAKMDGMGGLSDMLGGMK